MSYQEKNVIASLMSTLLIFSIYLGGVLHLYRLGTFNSNEVYHVWGIIIVGLVVLSIIANVIIVVIAAIINAIITREEDYLVDERDELIELRAMRNAHIIIGIGFLITIAALALDQPPIVVFNLMLFAFGSGQIAEYLSQIYMYRRGF